MAGEASVALHMADSFFIAPHRVFREVGSAVLRPSSIRSPAQGASLSWKEPFLLSMMKPWLPRLACWGTAVFWGMREESCR